MGLFKKKIHKIKREDIVNSLCELEKQMGIVEDKIASNEKSISELIEKGKREKSQDMRVLLAKRIVHYKEENSAEVKRAKYLLYNIRVLGKLKEALDSKNFVDLTSSISLTDVLKDQKSLSKFLEDANASKFMQEDILTEADNIFDDASSTFGENDRIYGVSDSDAQLLSIFESNDIDALDDGVFETIGNTEDNKN